MYFAIKSKNAEQAYPHAHLYDRHFGSAVANLDAQLRQLGLAIANRPASLLELLAERSDALLAALDLDLQCLHLSQTERRPKYEYYISKLMLLQ